MIGLLHSNAECDIMTAYGKPPRVLETHRGDGQSLREIDMHILSQTPSIYQIRHIESGRVYVGSAVNPRKRWYQHSGSLRRGTHHCRYLQHAWNKYGADAFVFEIIEPVLFVEDLLVREQYWIDQLESSNPKKGFNTYAVAGSPTGTKASPETRAKQSEARRGVGMRAAYSVRWSAPDARAKHAAYRSAANIERYKNPAERAKVSERAKARIAADPEGLARRAARQRATKSAPTWEHPKARDYSITAPDGTIYRTRNLARFCREHGLNTSGMAQTLAGRSKSHRGWRCAYG